MRCKKGAKDNGKWGLGLLAFGLTLVIVALVPVRALFLLCGMGLMILGALVFAGSRK